jgi:alginate O-acetyltransferase complex protein AlgI
MLVFLCVSLLWILFKLPNFEHAASYLAGMFTPNNNPNSPKLLYHLVLIYSLPVILQHFVDVPRLILKRLPAAEPYVYGAMAALAFLEAGPDSA